MKVWYNGNVMDANECRISILDHGLLYGDGVFEGIRITGGRVFRLSDHLARLQRSARALGIELPYTLDETAAIVRRLLIHSAGNFLSISEVAEQLHVTERTLRRRLAAEGTDFRTIFDDIKNTLAQNYLRKTSLSVVEIADLLNYAEATNFHRAFQRWNSTTPADYRQQASP